MALNTALDLHIAVRQGIQRLDAAANDDIQNDEIDFHLNMALNSYLEEVVSKSFEDITKDLDILRPLTRSGIALPVEIYEAPYLLRSLLPPDYYHILTGRANILYSKDAGLCADLSSLWEDSNGDAVKAQNTYYKAVVPFPFVTPPGGYSNFQVTCKISGTVTSVFKSKVITSESTDISAIVDDVLYNLNSVASFRNLQVWWEKDGDGFSENSFVFYTTDPTVDSIALTHDASTEAVFVAFTPVQRTDMVSSAPSALTSPQSIWSPIKVMELDEVTTMKRNVFYNTKKEEPLSYISGSFLYLDLSKSFLISNVKINYIRKPRRISLVLNRSCELAGNGPQIIADRTVERLKLLIESPDWQAQVQNNELRN